MYRPVTFDEECPINQRKFFDRFTQAGIDDIPKVGGNTKEKILEVLEGLSQRGIVFTGKMTGGTKGYALLQKGFGFPQIFHWKGRTVPMHGKWPNCI